MNRVRMSLVAIFICAGLPLSAGAQVVDLLPDLIVDPIELQDTQFVTDIIPGRLHLRLSNATPNIGLGPLRVLAGATSGNEQIIDQIINRSDLSTFTREAGRFIFHPTHNHFHVDDWAQYRIREVLPMDGVGAILFTGTKTSFCLLDSASYAGPVAGTPPMTPQFFSCGSSEQGISVGWKDIYPKFLPDQWIDVTGITPGEYWLESEVDPDDRMLEMDESNNVTRVKLTIAGGSLPVPDEIPLRREVQWILSVMLLLTGTAMLYGSRKFRGRPVR